MGPAVSGQFRERNLLPLLGIELDYALPPAQKTETLLILILIYLLSVAHRTKAGTAVRLCYPQQLRNVPSNVLQSPPPCLSVCIPNIATGRTAVYNEHRTPNTEHAEFAKKNPSAAAVSAVLLASPRAHITCRQHNPHDHHKH